MVSDAFRWHTRQNKGVTGTYVQCNIIIMICKILLLDPACAIMLSRRKVLFSSLKFKNMTPLNNDSRTVQWQHAKKVVSDSTGLVDFAIGLAEFCSQLKWSFFRNSTDRRTVKSILRTKMFWGLVEMTFGPVNSSFNLLEWQAAKITFFAPWVIWQF